MFLFIVNRNVFFLSFSCLGYRQCSVQKVLWPNCGKSRNICTYWGLLNRLYTIPVKMKLCHFEWKKSKCQIKKIWSTNAILEYLFQFVAIQSKSLAYLTKVSFFILSDLIKWKSYKGKSWYLVSVWTNLFKSSCFSLQSVPKPTST